jgi:hypothetical protein
MADIYQVTIQTIGGYFFDSAIRPEEYLESLKRSGDEEALCHAGFPSDHPAWSHISSSRSFIDLGWGDGTTEEDK